MTAAWIEVGDGANDGVDDAYPAEYGRYPSYIPSMLGSDAQATTLELVAGEEEGG